MQSSRVALLASTFLLLLVTYGHADHANEHFPRRTSYVNDYEHLLSSRTRHELEFILDDFAHRTTHEIIVASFSTYGDQSMESFMSNLADGWKIGYKDLANGVIFAIFESEHQASIQPGVGLEIIVPPGFRRDLIHRDVAPAFREKDYDSGTRNAVFALMRKIEPDYAIPARSDDYLQRKKFPIWRFVERTFSAIRRFGIKISDKLF